MCEAARKLLRLALVLPVARSHQHWCCHWHCQWQVAIAQSPIHQSPAGDKAVGTDKNMKIPNVLPTVTTAAAGDTRDGEVAIMIVSP